MSDLKHRVGLAILFIGLAMAGDGISEQQWTAAQQEIIDSIKSCWLAQTRDIWLSDCYHEDLVGWYKEKAQPITIEDKRNQEQAIWTDYEYEFVHFEPHGIYVDGNMGFAIYSAQLQWTEIATGELTVGKRERWMEALVLRDGKWLGIAEHASFMPEH